MIISPKDIKKNDFKKTIRGFDVNEVEAFLETVSSHYEKLVIENRQLNERVKELLSDIEVYKGNEQTLQKAIVKSQDLADEIVNNAKNKAEVIIKEAELNARKLKQDIEDDVIDKKNQLEEIKRKNENLIEDVRTFINEKMSEFEDFLKNRRIITMEISSREETSELHSNEESEDTHVRLRKISASASRDLNSNPFDDTFELK